MKCLKKEMGGGDRNDDLKCFQHKIYVVVCPKRTCWNIGSIHMMF